MIDINPITSQFGALLNVVFQYDIFFQIIVILEIVIFLKIQKNCHMNQHGTNRFTRVEPASPVEIIIYFIFHFFCHFSPNLRESRFSTG